MKKALTILFTVVLIALFSSCEDDTFTIEFTNGSSDTYALYINDVYQQDIDAKKKEKYVIPSGYWSAKVVQLDGYLFTPTVKKYSGTCDAGENYYIVFP